MEFIRGLHNLQDRHLGCVATIGKFDGVHLGHRAIIESLRHQANFYGVPVAVVIFEPLPQEVLTGKPAVRLMNLREKYHALQTAGVDRLICIHFDSRFSNLPAEDFIRHTLVEKLGVRYLIVGNDFRFGKQRSGDRKLLESFGATYDFAVSSMPQVSLDGARVSSSAVRAALSQGDFAEAKKLLGHPYTICGRVVHGDARGRTLGTPTANILLGKRLLPLCGVFAVTVRGLDHVYHGVANVGLRPTVGGKQTSLEVHLFDFSEEIYGRFLKVEFHHKIRDEQRFETLTLLQQQIAQDIVSAQQFFKDKA
jgi:riboflavin kinase/FMN adenylyltransferase